VKLVMTLLVRDEEDILAANLDFHLSQGVDFFIITDNLSVDGTRGIIDSYVRRKLAVRLDEPTDDYSQARWVTRMARMAAVDYRADWVINNDADEFWVGSSSAGLKRDLAAVAPDVQSLLVPRFNFVPVDFAGAGFFAERMTLRERQSYNSEGQPLPPKACHRACPDIEVDQGNHQVRRSGTPMPAAPSSLRILHYPLRSYRQFENKIARGGAAYARNTELPEGVGRTWRNLYKLYREGRLPHYYREQVVSAEDASRRLLGGELVFDDTLLQTLRPRVSIRA